MPELPDLQVIVEYLAPRLADAEIRSVEVLRPLIVRNLLGGELAGCLVGRRFAEVRRRGKFLLLGLDDGTALVINPMLAGRLRLGEPLGKNRVRDALVVALADGRELRYHDARDMGKIYLTLDLGLIPGFLELGPDADDPSLTSPAFRDRIRRLTGEIKGVLTNQSFVAGIGNAYADEILWRAGIYPMRRRPTLSDDETVCLYESMRETLAQAVATLRQRVGDAIDLEVRDFLAVHNRGGQPCPRCGSTISSVTREQRTTNFCRTCQPGLMVSRRPVRS